MRVLVSWDANNIWKKTDGSYWSNSIHSYSFVERYLQTYEEVALVTRVFSKSIENEETMMRVDGPGVCIRELPMLRGAKGYILGYWSLKKSIKKAVKNVDCAIFRIPSVIGYMLLDEFKKTGKPYAVEVVVDPFDAYKDNKIVQKIFTRKLKKAVLAANGASYVTKQTLQNRYPSAARLYGEESGHFESHYSSIDLKEEFFSEPRVYENKNTYKIIHTANAIHHNGKGHLELIDALYIVRKRGYDVSVTFIGDGSKRKQFEEYAISRGLKDYVNFTGLLTGSAAIREVLLSGDMFVLPTKYEGLPRSVIEAMAVGLPCIASPVGGTCELLDDSYLVNSEDVEGLANKIIWLIEHPNEMTEASERNIEKAREYRQDILSVRRKEFYQKLKECATLSENN